MPIVNNDNLRLFQYYVNERNSIFNRKQAKEYPLTEDKIFRNHRFINIHRQNDTQTKMCVEHIINNPDLTIEDKILNIIMFRGWGIWETVRFFGGCWTREQIRDFDTALAEKKYKQVTRINPKYKFFTNAAYVAALKVAASKYGSDNAVTAIFGLAKRCIDLPERILSAKNEQEVLDMLTELPGVANFLGYQIFLDMTYLDGFPFTDDHFVVATTRVKRAVRILFKYSEGYSYEECIKWLQENQEVLMPDLDVTLSLTDVQSSLYGFADYFEIRSKNANSRV